MKILVVGYACDPYRGSEPGVGWMAVCRIARRHEVWVLTDIHNREGWDKAAREGLVPPNVRVRFLRERSACSENRFVAHVQSWLNYASFNRQVLAAAESWHREIGFDLCHQVTIAAWRMPSPLWRLPLPLVWGPVGGSGYIPRAFRPMLSPSARLFEKARDLNTIIGSHSRAFLDCIRNTAVVIAANEETEEFLTPFRKGLLMLRLPVTSMAAESIARFKRTITPAPSSGPLKLFAGGNMEGRKGVSLALRALTIVAAKGIDFQYTIAGGGPEIPSLRTLANELGITDRVIFHPGFRGDEYLHALWDAEVYFLPSFRETMGMTLVEAILAGCYPVVADTSAQGEIVRLAGGKAVPVDTMDGLTAGLADALTWCARHREELPHLAAEAAALMARYCSSERYDATLDEAYQTAVRGYRPH